jgi:hypothetical protein
VTPDDYARRDIPRLIGAAFLSIAATIVLVQIVTSERWSPTVGWMLGGVIIALSAAALWWLMSVFTR